MSRPPEILTWNLLIKINLQSKILKVETDTWTSLHTGTYGTSHTQMRKRNVSSFSTFLISHVLLFMGWCSAKFPLPDFWKQLNYMKRSLQHDLVGGSNAIVLNKAIKVFLKPTHPKLWWESYKPIQISNDVAAMWSLYLDLLEWQTKKRKLKKRVQNTQPKGNPQIQMKCSVTFSQKCSVITPIMKLKQVKLTIQINSIYGTKKIDKYDSFVWINQALKKQVYCTQSPIQSELN